MLERSINSAITDQLSQIFEFHRNALQRFQRKNFKTQNFALQIIETVAKIPIEYFKYVKLTHDRDEAKEFGLFINQVAREIKLAKVRNGLGVDDEQNGREKFGQMRHDINETIVQNHAIQVLFALLNQLMVTQVDYLIDFLVQVTLKLAYQYEIDEDIEKHEQDIVENAVEYFEPIEKLTLKRVTLFLTIEFIAYFIGKISPDIQENVHSILKQLKRAQSGAKHQQAANIIGKK